MNRLKEESKSEEIISAQESGFSKQFVKLFKKLRKNERLKYLPPRFSSFMIELAEYYGINIEQLDMEIHNGNNFQSNLNQLSASKYNTSTYYCDN